MKKLLLFFLILLTVANGAFADDDVTLVATAFPTVPDVANATTIDQQTTINNQQPALIPSLITRNLTYDLGEFQKDFQNSVAQTNYVPIEAKVGRVLIGAMTKVGEILNRSLFGFISIFIIVLLALWIMMEGYQFATKGGDAKKLAYDIMKKVVLCAVWIWIISHGPAEMFMYLMGPIIYVGSYFSDLILGTVAPHIPDSCAAIHNYIAQNPVGGAVIPPDAVANILCVPTRMSAFFYSLVSTGFKWMIAGIGHSAMTFFVGAAFVIVFIMNIWKFALVALGVVVNLFLVLLFLPFTAIAETFGDKTTNYEGAIGKEIFVKFAGIFSTVSLSSQFQKFIQAVIYFVFLSVIVAICAALLSGVVDLDAMYSAPTFDSLSIGDAGPMTIFLCGILVYYLATQAEKLAKELGGDIDSKFGETVAGDIKSMWGNTRKTAKDIWKIVKK